MGDTSLSDFVPTLDLNFNWANFIELLSREFC